MTDRNLSAETVSLNVDLARRYAKHTWDSLLPSERRVVLELLRNQADEIEKLRRALSAAETALGLHREET